MLIQFKRNFSMHLKTKNFVWLTFVWDSFHCSGVEPNPQYLQGKPVVKFSVNKALKKKYTMF